MKSKSTKKGTKIKKKVKDKKKELEGLSDIIDNPPVASVGEKEYMEEYLHMYKRLQRITRKLEKKILDSDYVQTKLLYGLSTLYSQQREVIADIRTVSDMSEQVGLISENILKPVFREITQCVLDAFYQKRKLVREIAKDSETKFALRKLDEIVKDEGKLIQSLYEKTEQRIVELLLGNLESSSNDLKQTRKKRKKVSKT